PLQWLPVTALATADSDLYTWPWYSKPCVSTWTCTTSPLYVRVKTVPGGGSRVSAAMGVDWIEVRSGAGSGERGVRGAVVRRAASLAISAARRWARWERPPSARDWRRQARRLSSQARLVVLGRSPKSSA